MAQTGHARRRRTFARPLPLSAVSLGASFHVFLTAALHESRFEKEAHSLLSSGEATEVVLAARAMPGLPNVQDVAKGICVERIALKSASLPKSLTWQVVKGIEFRSRVVSRARRVRPAVIVAHSLMALAPAIAAGDAVSAPVLYDAHELETEKNGVVGLRQAFDRRLEAALIRRVAGVVCVSDSIADWYANRYRIARPVVVRNVPDPSVQRAAATPHPLRQRLGLGPDAQIFLYQGGFFAGRRLEQFVRVFAAERGFRHLVLMGYGELGPELERAAATHSNIHVVPAVPPAEVLAHSADADVGLVGVDDACLSYRYSLPNKLFEFLGAGLPVIAPKFPEMERVIAAHGCGVTVGPSDADWRDAIAAVPRDWRAQLAAATAAAAASITWAEEGAKFVAAHRAVREEFRA